MLAPGILADLFGSLRQNYPLACPEAWIEFHEDSRMSRISVEGGRFGEGRVSIQDKNLCKLKEVCNV